jgi:hypothetical protein
LKALVQVRSQWQQPVLKYCWIWFGFVFFFFSLANTKLPHYLLYAGPAMCLILTRSALDAGRKSWALSWALGLVGFALILWLPAYLQQHTDLLKDAYYQKLIEASQRTQMVFILLAIPVLLFSKVFVKKLAQVVFGIQLDFAKGASFTAFAVFHSMILALVVLPWWSRSTNKTRLPCCAKPMARCRLIVLLPDPPLNVVTAYFIISIIVMLLMML